MSKKAKFATKEEAKIWMKTMMPQLLHQKELIDKGLATVELERKHLEDCKRYVEAIALVYPDQVGDIKIPWKKLIKKGSK